MALVHIEVFPKCVLDKWSEKEQIKKVLEEAAEAYSAWEKGDPDKLAIELAGTVQACFNTAARMGVDLRGSLLKVQRGNEQRGRYSAGRKQ